MFDKVAITEEEYVYLTKGIAIGAGIGIVAGAIFGNVVFGFSLGGALGIPLGLLYASRKKHIKHDDLSNFHF